MTTYIMKDTLAEANVMNNDLTQRILEALPRKFQRYTNIIPHPEGVYTGTGEIDDPWVYVSGDQRCLLDDINSDFDYVATPEELALKITSADVEALRWFMPQEE